MVRCTLCWLLLINRSTCFRGFLLHPAGDRLAGVLGTSVTFCAHGGGPKVDGSNQRVAVWFNSLLEKLVSSTFRDGSVASSCTIVALGPSRLFAKGMRRLHRRTARSRVRRLMYLCVVSSLQLYRYLESWPVFLFPCISLRYGYIDENVGY